MLVGLPLVFHHQLRSLLFLIVQSTNIRSHLTPVGEMALPQTVNILAAAPDRSTAPVLRSRHKIHLGGYEGAVIEL